MKNYDEVNEWLYTSPNALEEVLRGIEDSASGEVEPLDEDFTKYLKDED